MSDDAELSLIRDALEAHPAPTLVVGADGAVLHANAAAVEQLGASVRVFPGEDVVARLRGSAAAEGRIARGVASLGTSKWEVSVAPLPRREELVIALSLPVPEVDLEALAAGLAHEIRNPLAGVQGAAELLAADLPADSPHRAYAELIAGEARRVDRLVRSLLDLTRPPSLHVSAHNVHEVCEHVAELAGASARRAIEKRYDPSLPELEIDRDAVVQVLLNLLRNALQAMEGRDGTITIETAAAAGTRVRIGGRTRGLARISILDDGPGLPKDLDLFTPFVTGRRGGTGLGLVIARRLVEAHGGRLELRDRREGGAEATVLLPFA